MKPFVCKRALLPGLAALILALPAQGSVNKSIRIDDGATSDGESSVNGSLTVGTDATVTGRLNTVNGTIRIGAGSVIEKAETVNGGIRLDDNVRARDLETVNGAIKLGRNVGIEGDVTAVNGSITADEGGTISGKASNVNGDIELVASTVGGDVATVSGDVELWDGAVIRGDLVVQEPKGWSWGKQDRNRPKIVIGPGCRVEGTIRLEREVRLYISETAEVGGVTGKQSLDDAVRFSGKRP